MKAKAFEAILSSSFKWAGNFGAKKCTSVRTRAVGRLVGLPKSGNILAGKGGTGRITCFITQELVRNIVEYLILYNLKFI